MLRRFWLFFAQAVTVLLALMFIIATLKPQWLQRQGQFGKQLAEPIVALREVAPGIGGGSGPAQASYADAAHKAMPAVVNVFSSKDGSLPPDPRAKDPLFRYFFGDRNNNRRQQEQLQAKSRHQHLASLGRYVRLGEETSARITAEADPAQRRRPR